MLNAMLKEVIRGAIRGMATQLSINPRNIRLMVLLDEEENLLSRIDASVVKDLLNKPASKRVLRLRVGNLAYDIDLGSSSGNPRRVSSGVKQRGY